MRPSDLSTILPSLLRPGLPPVYLWGPPGVGKSDLVRQAAQALGIDLIDLRVVLLDPIDLRGMPKIGAKDVKWVPPNFLPTKGEGILFLDELAQAAPLVQAATLQLVLDRRVGEYELPSGWRVVAASNRVEDRAGAHRLISPLLNRFVHLDVEVDLEEWLKWAVANDIDTSIRYFLAYRPALLHTFDASRNERSFATPRSWAFASRVLKVLGPDHKSLMMTLAGTVGEGAATEYVSFLRVANQLPAFETIIAEPNTTRVPPNADALYALCGLIEDRSRKVVDPHIVSAVVRYVDRLPSEYAAMLMLGLHARAPAFTKHIDVAQWFRDHKHLIIGR